MELELEELESSVKAVVKEEKPCSTRKKKSDSKTK